MLLTQLAADIAQGFSPPRGLCAPRVVQIVGEESALTMTCLVSEPCQNGVRGGRLCVDSAQTNKGLVAQALDFVTEFVVVMGRIELPTYGL